MGYHCLLYLMMIIIPKITKKAVTAPPTMNQIWLLFSALESERPPFEKTSERIGGEVFFSFILIVEE